MARTKHKQSIQFIEYLISGGAYFWVGYLAFALFYGAHTDSINFDGLGWSLWWATIVSSVIGWVVNFILQRYWVFNNKSLNNHKTEVTTRYIIITLVDFVLNYFILLGLRSVGITPYIGQFISAGFFTIWNYLWYKYWVFPEQMSKSKSMVRPIAHLPHGRGAYHKTS